VDLDGDGQLDLISGSWPGELFFFKGHGKANFDAPVKLKDNTGHTINIGGGIRPNMPNEVLVAGDATFDTDKDGKQFIVYEGQRIEIPEGKTGGITGTASAVHAADLDGDGDIDLIVGEIGGNVYLVPNLGSTRAWSFGKEEPLRAEGQPIRVEGDAGPFVADWDGDGKIDLLVGSGDGSVRWYRNTGQVDEKTRFPIFGAGQVLVPKVPQQSYGPDSPSKPTRGIRSKVCAADWNGDGRLDLLIGDFTTQKPNLPEPTAEEKATQDKLRADLVPIQNRYNELSQQYFNDQSGNKRSKAEREKLMNQMNEAMQKMMELRKKLPPEYDNHGWVWLFLRKAPDRTAAVK
jgi:hypothetical protein